MISHGGVRDFRGDVVRYHFNSASSGTVPVVAVSPSYDEEAWGGISHPDGSCLGPPRTRNAQRDLALWGQTLNEGMDGLGDQSWLYIEAYNQYAEGSALGPSTQQGFAFLATLKDWLIEKGYLAGEKFVYTVPAWPAGY